MIRSIGSISGGRAVLAAIALLAAGCNIARATPPPSAPPAVSSTPSNEPSGGAERLPTPSTDPAETTLSEASVVIESVTDGDTIVVSGGVRVRLIGMDTPETRHPDRGVECFGPEASDRTAELLPPGEPVRLVLDEDRFDRYERTLAYVYRIRDDVFINAELVRDGFARAGTYPPNIAHDAEFRQLEAEARTAGRGLWATCPADADTAAAPPPPPLTPDLLSGACDPAYPDGCIPALPPDLSCADVAHRFFTVLPPDPHEFDGNGDGVGCEIP